MMYLGLHIIDWLLIAVYMFSLLLIGFLYNKKAGKNLTGFFLSGRSVPWWLVGTSLAAGHFGASKPIMVVQTIREYGIEHMWYYFYVMPATVIGAVVVAKLWRRCPILTGVEFIRFRYSGAGAHLLTLWRSLVEGVIMRSFFIGVNLIALQKIMEVLMPEIPFYIILIIVSGIVLIYSSMSGLYAVILTDFLQFIFSVAGILGLVAIIYIHVGSPAALLEAVRAIPGKETIPNILPQLPTGAASPHEWMKFFDFLLYIVILWAFHGWLGSGGCNPQRLLAAKDERNTVLQCLWADVIDYGLVFWLLIIVGLGSLVMVGSASDNQTAYIEMGLRYLPTGLRGLFFVSLFAALMSTFDTHLNMTASFIVNDLYKLYFVKNASNRHYLFIARLSTILMMVSGVLFWIVLKHATILNNMKLMLLLIAGGGLVQFVAWYWWRVNAWSVLAGMIGSAIITTIVKWILPACSPWFASLKLTTDHYPFGLLIIVSLSTVIWVATTLLTKPTTMKKLKNFYTFVRPMGRWAPVRKELGNKISGDRFGKYDIIAILSGIAAVYGIIFGIGNVFLGHFLIGILLFALAGIATKTLLWAFGKNEWWHRDIDKLRAENGQEMPGD